MTEHLDIGVAGEQYAFTHLIEKGYTVLERNWRFKRSEIDIIAKKGGNLAFVEVKTRTSDYMGDPVMAVSKSKQRHIIRAADQYMKEYPDDPEVRFDIIGIIMNKKGVAIEHVEDAFYPLL